MRYCPNCQRINVGHPLICNYCGRTWYVKLCPRGHANLPDVQFCGECGSTDLSDPAGPKPWWSISFRPVFWVLLILFALSIGGNMENILPQLIIASIPIVLLLSIYVFIGSLNIALFSFITRLVFGLGSKLLSLLINVIKWIFVGNDNSRGK